MLSLRPSLSSRSLDFLVGLFAASIVILAILKDKLTKKRLLPLPPGPPADPILGHLRLIPSGGQDIFFYRLGKIYGDVVHLRVLGRSLIILNSVQAAVELLEKRSANYSDRPKFTIYEMCRLHSTFISG